MSVRRDAGARVPPAAARPGTLCGPAITLATSGSYRYAPPGSGLSLTSAPKPTTMHYDPDAHAEAIYAEAKEMYDSMSPQERWDWMQSVGNVSVSSGREYDLEQIKEQFEEWGVHDPADDEEDEEDEDAEEAALLAQQRAIQARLAEIQDKKRQRRETAKEKMRVTGRISYSSLARQEYCVVDDANGIWWYPNVMEPKISRSLGGIKLFVKTRDVPHEEVEFTSEGDDYYKVANRDDPPPLKFRLGEKVSFVPYTRSQLLFDKDGKLIIHCDGCEVKRDPSVAIPDNWAGVATQVRRLG